MSYSPSFIPSYQLTTRTLGVSVLVCTVIAYTLAKMFRFGGRNEFPVEGRVSGMPLFLEGIVVDRFSQTVLITGGSDGMGRAAAVQLAGKGANVVVVARTLSKLQSTVEELKVRTVLLFFTFNLLTHTPGQVSQLEEATLLLHQC